MPSVGTCSGTYVLALQSPLENTLWKSAAIKCNEPGNTFGGIIQSFFQGSTRLAGNIQTDFVMYDVNNVKTTNTALAKKYVYTITSLKRSAQATFVSHQIIPVGTVTAIITVMPPSGASGVPSSMPLTGSYIIKCPDPNGRNFQTRP